MNPEECEALILKLTALGWIVDVNDENRLGFIFPVDDKTEWFRDYNKSTGRFIQGNGKQIINLRSEETK